MRSIGRIAWPVLCLFQFGILAGWIVLRSRQVPLTENDVAETGHVEPIQPRLRPRRSLSPERAARELVRTDDLLRQGRHELALVALRESDAPGPALPYRRALCLEGLGQWDAALAEYGRVVSLTQRPEVRAAAEVGQARVWFRRGRPEAMRPLLGRLLLRSADPPLRDSPALAEARYLLALALAQQVAPPVPASPLKNTPARPGFAALAPGQALDWFLTSPRSKQGKTRRTPTALALKGMGNQPEEALVQARQQWTTAESLVARLAGLAGLEVRWSTEARQRAGTRSLEVAVEGWALGDVLRALGGTLGLTSHFKGKTLHVETEEQAPRPALASYRAAWARQALRSALIAAPGHVLTPAARLELGNLEALDGKLTEALAWYEQLASEAAHSGQAVEAHYNRGLVLRRLGKLNEARTAFYRAIDQSPAHELAALAHLRIGQTHLDEAEPAQALVPLRRAVTVAVDEAPKAASVLTLAAALLLSGEPRAAHTVLLDQREVVTRGAFRAPAAFLDALARHRVRSPTGSPGGRMGPDGNDLLSALLALPPDGLLGATSFLLRGQAYGELGMTGHLAQVYERALPRLEGPLAEEMSYALAEALRSQGKKSEALERYTSLAALSGSRWAGWARYSLAEMALQEGRAQECIDGCRTLLGGKGIPQTRVLRLLGQAFEKLGDYRRAARCFAGEAPE